MITVENICYAYGKHSVLNGICFTAEPGDCVGILGNNGAGKSTLITCLNKIRTPSAGSIHIDGRNVFDMSRIETAQNIAYVAQKNEMSRTTVYDAVLLGRKPYMRWGMTEEDYRMCDDILERMGMADYKLRNIDELSGGEAQKVMLARAFVQQPELLLLDEPTSNLDPYNQYQMMQLVTECAREQGITVLVVIHDLNLALRYCNKSLFIKDGKVFSYGDTAKVTPEILSAVYGVSVDLAEVNGKRIAVIG